MRPRIALVTSGIGTKHGGIGVVAQLIVSALNDYADLAVWEHHAFWPRFARIPAAVGTALLGSIKTPDLVVYDHVDLAVLQAVIPRLKSVPYAVFLHGIEVWKPLVGRRREALLGAWPERGRRSGSAGRPVLVRADSQGGEACVDSPSD